MSTIQKEVVISVKDLAISFYTDKGRVKAVRGVSFDLNRGECLCIVGESGSGKSVTAKAIMGILPGNGSIDAGSIMYEGEDLTGVSEEEFHRIRGKKIGMIFQDPLSSLNPIMRIGKQLTEAVIINSNKLKKHYNDLIAPANIKYRNIFAKRTHKVETARMERDMTIKLLRDELETLGNSKEAEVIARKKAIKDEVKAAKAAFVSAKKAAFNDARPLIGAAKKNLNEAKKTASEEVKAIKKQLDAELKAKLDELNAQKAQATTVEAKAEINKKISDVKTEHVDKLKITRKAAKAEALKVMTEVGIPNAERRFKQFPFEFSGGMRQRIVIAIALTQNPDILILDEPTTALDVTIQAQILDLVKHLKATRNLSSIFITHDLGVVANMADRVAVMYAGKIVEHGTVEEIFFDPRHPYTWALLSSIPDVDSKERLEAIPGTPPNMVYPPAGDAFALRSRYAMAIDFKHEPPLFKVSETHYAATWLLDPRAPKVEKPAIVTERIRNSLKNAKKDGGNDK